jgi:DNA-binding NtrC family response regulator
MVVRSSLPARERTRRVILVEPDPELAAVLGECLRMAGHDVTVVPNSARAVDVLSFGGADVLVADLHADATGVTKLLESLHRCRSSIGVVVLGGMDIGRDAATAEALGVRWILNKPVAVEMLLTAVAAAAALDQRGSPPPQAPI